MQEACTQCSKPFAGSWIPWTQNRTRQICRICERVICKYDGDPPGCAAMILVHESLWNRKLLRMRVVQQGNCTICQNSCLCANGLVCKVCQDFLCQRNVAHELQELDVSLDFNFENSSKPIEFCLGFSLEPNFSDWLQTINCEYADALLNVSTFVSRVERVRSFLLTNVTPNWSRPAAAERQIAIQHRQTAIRVTGTALNILAPANIRHLYNAAKLAVSGYMVAQLIRDVVLSDEFRAAWRIVLCQMSDFITRHSAHAAPAAPAGLVQGLRTQAQATLDFVLRFYYYFLHRRLRMLEAQEPEGPPGTQATEADLAEVGEYVRVVSLLYTTGDGGRPSTDPRMEAGWFLSSLLEADGLILLHYEPRSAPNPRAERARNQTPRHPFNPAAAAAAAFPAAAAAAETTATTAGEEEEGGGAAGGRRPAFAVLADPSRERVVVAVRGTQEHHDGMVDIDFLPGVLNHCGYGYDVHRGMLASAKELLGPCGLRAMLADLPPRWGIRVVGHSLGAGVAALLLAMLLNCSEHKGRDVRGVGFATPACACPALAQLLAGRFWSVVNRGDLVPRLSLSAIRRVADELVSAEERGWYARQCAADYQDLWAYIGFPCREEGRPEPPRPAGGAGPEGGDEDGRGEWEEAGEVELVCPGDVLLLHQGRDGRFQALRSSFDSPAFRHIEFDSRVIEDHHMAAYIRVLHGLSLARQLGPRAPPLTPRCGALALRHARGAAAARGGVQEGWAACGLCKRDVTEVFVLHSDANRAAVTKWCRRCGIICCVECAPAGDKVPDLSQELWATRTLPDCRMVMPHLGTLEPLRVCLRCAVAPP